MRLARVGSAVLSVAVGVILVVPGSAGADAPPFLEHVTVLHAIVGGSNQTFFGWAVSELSDVDGDGVTDFLVSEPFSNGGAGTVYVYSGQSGQLLRTFDGAGPGDWFGYAIADAGDTNADGVPDILIGAPAVPGGGMTGRVSVMSGADGSLLRTVTGEQPNDRFGYAVSSAGDVDGDGTTDLLVGAVGRDANGVDSGRASVIASSDGSTIRTYDGRAPGDLFGAGVDKTADLDGDGVVDHLVGARNGGRQDGGEAYAFSGATGRPLLLLRSDRTGVDFGTFFVAGVGDLNGDLTPDVYVGDFSDHALGVGTGKAYVFSGNDGSVLQRWTGTPHAGMGPGREAGGDVDGDGLPDLIVGSYTDATANKRAGKVQLFSGADGHEIRSITSTSRNEQLGFDAVGLGDVSGDGWVDFLISGARAGTVYVIAGEAPQTG